MMLQHGKGARLLGRIGLCFASVSSIPVFVGPASAMVHEATPMYQDPNGEFMVPMTPGEVPGGGDPDGQGSAKLNLNKDKQEACFSISWEKLKGQVTALHLHAAEPGSEGPHWIDFFNNQQLPGVDSKSSGCVFAPADKIAAVIGNPSAYYLNLHSTAFTKGAIRGQLH